MGEREKDCDTLNFGSSRDILDKGDKNHHIKRVLYTKSEPPPKNSDTLNQK
jgi:hypothetical protein